LVRSLIEESDSMLTPFPPKTPMQMRREAEQRRNPQPKPRPPGDIDPASRPPQAFETPREVEATMDWLAHIAAGRIQIR
jgi:hypothetical protein